MQFSIVRLKEVKSNSKDFLLHSEFYLPKIIKFRNQAIDSGFNYLGNYVGYMKRGVQPLYSKEGTIEVLRSVNIREYGFSNDRQEYVTEELYQLTPRGRLKYKDVLLTSTGVGTLGRATINLTKDKYFVDSHIAIIRDLKNILPEFLYIYLNTKYGQSQINSLYKGSSGQIEIYPNDIEQILIKPLTIQEEIASLVNESYELKEEAKEDYKRAEYILLGELDLNDYKPKHTLTYTKKFSEVKKAERFDAEYFQPKYDDIIEKIKSCGYSIFKEVINIKDNPFAPLDNIDYKYIELSNISSNGEITGYTKTKGIFLPTRARRKVFYNDIIISSIEGSLDSIALITEELHSSLCSTGFFIVNSQYINSETILVLFKSIYGQIFLKRICKGTILTAFSKNDLDNIVIPIIEDKTQEKISLLVQSSFAKRKNAKKLLEIAKRAVEIAIEENEEVATSYINQEIK